MKKFLKIYFLLLLNLQILYACLDQSQLYMLLTMLIVLGLLAIWILRWFYKAWKEWKKNGFRFFE